MGSVSVRHMRFIVILLILCIPLSACDPYAGHYPYEEGTDWVCTEPGFVLTYSEAPNGVILEDAILEWDGETIAVSVLYQADSYCVSPVDSTADADKLFAGTWEYRGDDLVFHIEEDHLFGGQYDALVFSGT